MAKRTIDFSKFECSQTDKYMKHFMSQTFQIQGPEFENNIILNLASNNLRRDNTIESLPKITNAIIVGAGPSLKKNIHHLKKVQELKDSGHDIQIIVTDRAFPEVVKYCTPTYTTCLESTVSSHDDMKRWWKDVDTSICPIITVPYADDLLFDLWKGKKYFMNCTFNAPLMPHLMHLVDKVYKKTGAKQYVTGGNCGVFSTIIVMAKGDIPKGYNHTYLSGVMESGLPLEEAVPLFHFDNDYAVRHDYSNLKEMVKAWGLGDFKKMKKTYDEKGMLALRPKNSIKQLAFIGLDHCEYEMPTHLNMWTKDINGQEVYVPWTWFSGQFEIRILCLGLKEKAGTSVYNCTEGGIIYDENILHSKFNDYIELLKKGVI